MKKFLLVMLIFLMWTVNAYADSAIIAIDIPEKNKIKENQYLIEEST